MSWWSDWFGRDYLDVYAHRDDSEAQRQVDVILENLGPAGSVLDVACGGGRHSRFFAAAGVAAMGIDYSQDLIQLASLARTERTRFLLADMRRLPVAAESFELVVSLFTSLGYFAEDEENLGVLNQMERVLAPGGRIALDVLHPGPTVAGLVPQQTLTVPKIGEIEISRTWQAARRRIEKTMTFPDGRVFVESVRAFEPEELTGRLESLGLRVLGVHFHDVDGLRPLGPDDPRQLIFAIKPEAP